MVHCFSRSVCGVTNSLDDMYGLRRDENAGQGDIDMSMSTLVVLHETCDETRQLGSMGHGMRHGVGRRHWTVRGLYGPLHRDWYSSPLSYKLYPSCTDWSKLQPVCAGVCVWGAGRGTPYPPPTAGNLKLKQDSRHSSGATRATGGFARCRFCAPYHD